MHIGLDTRLSARAALILSLAVFAVSTVPLWFAEYPPLLDYPFHIARVYVIAHWHEIEELRQFYDMGSLIIPNVGMDVTTLLLSGIFPVSVAGRIFVGLTLGLMLSGCIALNRVLYGRFSPWPLVSCLFLFNWMLLFGFLSYLFGVGIMLWATAVWVLLSRRAAWVRLGVGTALAVILYFCHFVALALFAVIVAGYELQRAAALWRLAPWTALRDLGVGAAIFAIPLGLFAASATAGDAGGGIVYGEPWYGWKPFMLYRSLMSGNWLLDHLLAAAIVVCLGVFVAGGRLGIAGPMRLPLALLLAVFLVVPNTLFKTWIIDARLPVAILFVAIAATEVSLQRRAWDRAVIAGLAALLLVRSAVLANDWRYHDRVIAEFVLAFDRLPAGAVLVLANAGGYPDPLDIDLRYWRPPLEHVVSLAVLRRPVFVPATWAEPAQQTITVTDRFRALYAYQKLASIPVGSPEDLAAVIEDARRLAADASGSSAGRTWAPFVLLLDPQALPQGMAADTPAGAPVIASGSRFVLLTVGAAEAGAEAARSAAPR